MATVLDFPSQVTATDPDVLLGANATVPAKTAITAAGRTLIAEADVVALTTANRDKLNSLDLGAQIVEVEDFLSTSSLNLGLGTSASGTGAANTLDAAQTLADPTVYGSVLCNVGTTSAAARAGYSQFGTVRPVYFNASTPFTYTLSFRFAPVLLGSGADAANNSLIVLGWGNAVSSENPGFYFRVTNSGNIFAVVRRSNTGPDETAVDTGLASTLNTMRNLSIRYIAGGLRVEFYSGTTLLTSIGPTGAVVNAVLPTNLDSGIRANILGPAGVAPAQNYSMRLDTIRTARSYASPIFPV